jgi:hypothetical protein
MVVHRVWEGTPLLVAANRDEHLSRPSSPPALRSAGSMVVLAPRDERAHGTWIGVSAAGVFAGITNRAAATADPTRLSRGGLVLAALEARTAAEGARRIASLRAADYNGFHLVVADRSEAHLVWSDGGMMRTRRLGPGSHVFCERSLGAAEDRRADRLLSWVRDFESAPEPPNDAALRARLSFHDPTDPFAGTCVHLPPELPYGTRSSTLIRLGAVKDEVYFANAEGPPCRTQLCALTNEVRALGAAATAR